MVVLVGMLGSVFAVFTEGWLVSGVLFATVAVCVGTISGNLRLLSGRPSPSVPSLLRAAVGHAVMYGLAGVGCFGLGNTIGPWALGLMAMLAVIAPPVVGRLDSWLGSSSAGHEEPFGTAEFAVADLRGWSDAELYAVWRSTSSALHRAAGADKSATLSRAREYLLAEFERRHPADVAAWLREGLAGQPPRFLLANSEDRSQGEE